MPKIEKLVGSDKFGAEELLERSPVQVPGSPNEQFALALQTLFLPDETVELVAGRTRNGGKAAPSGTTIRHSTASWVSLAKGGDHLTPFGHHCGVFMRSNPVDGSHPGSGANNATTDKDVSSFRYMLLEHDRISKELQINLLASLSLPIAAMVDSGGSSVHALIKVGAVDIDDFSAQVDLIYRVVDTYYGFDPSNKNPSRLTRAPGFTRSETSQAPQLQRLLYLNPNPSLKPIKAQ